MKLDSECVRAILLETEKLAFEDELSFDELKSRLPKFTEDQLAYTCIKLKEGELLKVATMDANNHTFVMSIYDLTYKGHEFLNNIHSESVWNTVKSIGSQIGATSVGALTQIAVDVVTVMIKQQLKLP